MNDRALALATPWPAPTSATATAAAATVQDAVKLYRTADGHGLEVRALDGVTTGFERGRFTAIMGPSGSGKSTLLHCLAGLDTLTAGHVFIGDTHLGSLDDRSLTRLRRDRIGFVFQAFNLLPTLTAAENITLPLALAGRRPDPAWFDRIIDVVGLRDRLHHRPSQLSGGQQQRVAAARALVSRPEIIFADEPTGNLDSRAGSELLDFMRRAVDEFGQTIVMVTHDPKAASVTDRVVFLRDGSIVDDLDEPSVRSVIRRMQLLGG
ncbi:MAG: ABC transporter ATP-binding protein [Acidimicrobiales bacterium]